MSDPVKADVKVHAEYPVTGDFTIPLGFTALAGEVLGISLFALGGRPSDFAISDPDNGAYRRVAEHYEDPVGIGYVDIRLTSDCDEISVAVEAFAGAGGFTIRRMQGLDTEIYDQLPVFKFDSLGGDDARIDLNETTVANDYMFCDFISFSGVTLQNALSGWSDSECPVLDGLTFGCLERLPGAWGNFSAGWNPIDNSAHSRKFCVGAIAYIGIPTEATIKTITPEIIQQDESFTVTGKIFGATAGTLGRLTIDDYEAQITSWSESSGVGTVVAIARRGPLTLYGKPIKVRLRSDTGSLSNIKTAPQMIPKDDWDYVDIITPIVDPTHRVQGIADLETNDQVLYRHFGRLVSMTNDGDQARDPSIARVPFYIGVIDEGWGALGEIVYDGEFTPPDILTLLPDQAGYSFADGIEVVRSYLNGVGYYSYGILNSAIRLNCQWSVRADNYELLRNFYAGHVDKGHALFTMYLAIEEEQLQAYKAKVVPGSFGLLRQMGDLYVVGCALDVQPLPKLRPVTTLGKLLLAPNSDSYSFVDVSQAHYIPLPGGVGKTRRDLIGVSNLVGVRWSVNPVGLVYLRDFYRQWVANPRQTFPMDLIIDSATMTEMTCKFLPGSMKLESMDGAEYNIGAQLEVVDGAWPIEAYT